MAELEGGVGSQPHAARDVVLEIVVVVVVSGGPTTLQQSAGQLAVSCWLIASDPLQKATRFAEQKTLSVNPRQGSAVVVVNVLVVSVVGHALQSSGHDMLIVAPYSGWVQASGNEAANALQSSASAFPSQLGVVLVSDLVVDDIVVVSVVVVEVEVLSTHVPHADGHAS
jgi:hypothetical protein